MEMSPEQIASEYRTAANRSKQIKVLAELNLVTQRQIAEILRAQGEELPGHWQEKLARGLKGPARGRLAGFEPVTARELGEAIAETVTPDTSSAPQSGAPLPASPLSASGHLPCQGSHPQGEGRGSALSLDEIRKAKGVLIPAELFTPTPVGLTLDEIRQDALRLLRESAPLEPESFQSFARGIAALVEALGERADKRTGESVGSYGGGIEQ